MVALKNSGTLVLSVSIVGAALSSWSIFRVGERRTMYFSNVFLISSLILWSSLKESFAEATSAALFAFGAGLSSTASPLLIRAISSIQNRGLLIGLYGLFLAAGQFLSIMISFGIVLLKELPWIHIQFLPIMMIILHTIILKYIDVNEEAKESDQKTGFFQTTWSSMKKAEVRKSLGAGVLVQVLKALSGIECVIHFGPAMMELAGFQSVASNFSIVTCSLSILGSLISLLAVDRTGRKPILILSLVMMSFSLFILPMQLQPSLKVGFVFFFLIGYSLGFSAVHITMNCELYPPIFLPTGCAVAATSNLISSIAVSFVFLYLSQWSEAGSFYLFTLFCAVGALLVAVLVPETKDLAC